MSEQTPFDVKEAKVDEVLAEVKAGRISPEDALAAEKASEPVRKGVTEPLEKMIEDAKAAQESTDVNPNAPTQVSPQNPAPAVAAAVAVEKPKKANPNNYSEVRVKVTKRVLDVTAGRGTYFDTEQKEDIGKEPVTVLATPFVNGLIRSQELEVVS